MNRFMLLVVSAAALCLLMAVTPVSSNAQISFAIYQVTDNAADDGSADVAMDVDGNTHVVYIRGGNVYYKMNVGSEEMIGAGDSPAIAVSPAGVPHVVYISGGSAVYSHRTGGTWSAGVNMTYGSVGFVDIDVDALAKAHIVYSCNADGDGYAEIVYATNASGSFVESLLADGWYYDHAGNYYYHPCIKVDAAGNFRVVVEQQNWGGQASYSGKNILYLTPTTSASSEGFGWNQGVTTGKNSIALDGSGNAHVLYYSGGTIYYAFVSGTTWTGGSLAGGAQGAIAVNGSTVAIAYNDGTDHIAYTQNTGSGFSTPQPVDAGQYPSIALGAAHTIVYDKSDGADREIYLASDMMPLPIQLASFVALPAGQEVTLQWRTVSEMNNYGFYVQRLGTDGVTYADIAGSFVAGHGTTTAANEYSYVDLMPKGDGWYRLRQVDLDGRVHYSEPVQASTLTGVTTNGPVTFALSQNYPNPFNPSTQISFGIAETGQVHLVVFDQLGREVATLVNGVLPAGRHAASFNAAGCASGVYFARLTAGNTTSMIRMMLMK